MLHLAWHHGASLGVRWGSLARNVAPTAAIGAPGGIARAPESVRHSGDWFLGRPDFGPAQERLAGPAGTEMNHDDAGD